MLGRDPGNLYYKIAGWLWGPCRCHWVHHPLPAPEVFSQSHSSPLGVCPVHHAQCFAGQSTTLLFPPDRNHLQNSLTSGWLGRISTLALQPYSPSATWGNLSFTFWCLHPSAISNYHSLFCYCLVKLYMLFKSHFPLVCVSSPLWVFCCCFLNSIQVGFFSFSFLPSELPRFSYYIFSGTVENPEGKLQY